MKYEVPTKCYICENPDSKYFTFTKNLCRACLIKFIDWNIEKYGEYK